MEGWMKLLLLSLELFYNVIKNYQSLKDRNSFVDFKMYLAETRGRIIYWKVAKT